MIDSAPHSSHLSLEWVIQGCLGVKHISLCGNRLTEGIGRIIMRKLEPISRADPVSKKELHTLVLVDQPVAVKSAQACWQLSPKRMIALRKRK
jgi:hypothetical protein